MSDFFITALEIKCILSKYGYTFYLVNGKNIFDYKDDYKFKEIPKEFKENNYLFTGFSMYVTGCLDLYKKNHQFLDNKSYSKLTDNSSVPKTTLSELRLVDSNLKYINESEKMLLMDYITNGKLYKIDKKYWNMEFIDILMEFGFTIEELFILLLKVNITLAHELNLKYPLVASQFYKEMPEYKIFLDEIPKKNLPEVAEYISNTEVAKDFIKLYPEYLSLLDPEILDEELLQLELSNEHYWYLNAIDYSILNKEMLDELLEKSNKKLDILSLIRDDYPNYSNIVIDTIDSNKELQDKEKLEYYFKNKDIYNQLLEKYIFIKQKKKTF